jgi:hypothetical protein
MEKWKVGELPAPSAAFTTDVLLEQRGSGLALRFQYDDEGVKRGAVLEFEGVRAHRHLAEGVCSAWHVEEAFDTIVDVRGSPWLEELEVVAYERGQPPGELHHFMVYIDGDGCYEVVARSWRLLDGGPVG